MKSAAALALALPLLCAAQQTLEFKGVAMGASEQVFKRQLGDASKVFCKPTRPPRIQADTGCLVEGITYAGAAPLDVVALFYRDRLGSVVVQMRRADAATTAEALTARYGKGRLTKDATAEIRLIWEAPDGTVTLSYSPLVDQPAMVELSSNEYRAEAARRTAANKAGAKKDI